MFLKKLLKRAIGPFLMQMSEWKRIKRIAGIGAVIAALTAVFVFDDYLYFLLFENLFGWKLQAGLKSLIMLILLMLNILLAYAVFKVMRRKPETGKEGLVGAIGVARSEIARDVEGWIEVHGERWQAVSQSPISPGQRVRVVQVGPGLLLRVQKEEGRRHWRQ